MENDKRIKSTAALLSAKRITLIPLAALLICLFTVFAFSGCSVGTKTVDFKEYTTVSFAGFNGQGYAEVNVDYESIAPILGEQNLLSAYAVLDSFKTAQIENNGSLSNGDKIKVVIEYKESVLKKVNLAVKNTELEFEVSGLNEKEELDIFSDVEIVVEGYSPLCTVRVNYNGDVEALQKTGLSSPFLIRDKNDEYNQYYGNGDTVVISVSEETARTTLGIYNIKELSKEYTINVDTSYIGTASDLNADELATLDGIAEGIFNDNISSIIEGGSSSGFQRTQFIKDISGLSVGSAAITDVSNINLNSRIVGFATNPNAAMASLGRQSICVAYYFYDTELTFDWKYFTNTGTETAHCTYVLCFKNPIISPDGITYYDVSLTGYKDFETAYSKTTAGSDFDFEQLG